ncbi:MAG: hypothetical protein JWQ66_2236 [Mucilaginibacter sp.]|nr:hypothetical protein [Mucilaginibacter sp.]
MPRGSELYLLSLLNDHFFMFVNQESLLIFCLVKGPVCFGTAKVRTFFASAKLIFYFLFRFNQPSQNNPLTHLRAAKVSRLLDCANAG